MERELELVRDIFRRFNDGDREISADEWCDDVEISSQLAELRGTPYTGREGVEEYLSDVEDNFDEWRVNVRELRPVGERVLALGQVHLRGRGSGLALDLEFGWVFEFRDGMILRMAIMPDPEEAERQAGRQ
jgi:ketosteroid isomerase-like protein